MKTVTRSVARLAFALFAGLTVAALVVGSIRPTEGPAKRRLQPSRLFSIDRSLYWSKLGELQALDPGAGRITRIELPGRELIDSAGFSPWRDEDGNWQVVGRWMQRDGAGMQAAGLARFLHPEGLILDRVETQIQPIGPPCWFPGGSTKVLYAAGDGRLYRFDFGESGPADRTGRRPRHISWEEEDQDRRLILFDPIWPDIERLGGKIFVALSTRIVSPETRRLGSSIWWLQLDSTRSTIVASGRVTPGSGEDAESDEFRPSIATTPEGDLLMAYLAHDARTSAWELHLAPLQIDPGDGIPRVLPNAGIVLETTVKPGRPIFSPDARELFCALSTPKPIPQIARFPVSEFGLELAREAGEADNLR